jgi:sugar phosphate isomerase/epimerase
MMEVNADLLAGCWTSAGNAGPSLGDEMSPTPLRERVEAVAQAGFAGFGLFHRDLIEAAQSIGLPTLASLFRDNGIRNVELEFLTDWWATGEARKASDHLRAQMFESAGELGVKTIKVSADLSSTPLGLERYTEEFGALAREAKRHGVRVALEFMPMASPCNIQEAVKLVRDAGEPAGGLCVDIWHVARAGTSYAEMVPLIPLESLFVVELNDAASELTGTLWEDTINNRTYCGEGDFDVPQFVSAILSTGYTGGWCVEIIGERHRATPIKEGLKLAHDSALSAIAAASAPSAVRH